MTVRVHAGDCLDLLAELPDNSVDAAVMDPPYGLSEHSRADIELALTAWLSGDRDHVPTGRGGFMGKDWDRFVPPPAVWDECFRVLKPGGHLLAFCGTRTVDLMGMSIRLARIGDQGSPEMRDSLAWMYGSGFPKSRDIGKAIDAEAGAVREVVGLRTYGDGQTYQGGEFSGRSAGHMGQSVSRQPSMETAPATEAAQQWDGWGTALKPAFEPIVVARKPLSERTVAANVLRWGTGALNIDGCRIAADGENLGRRQTERMGGIFLLGGCSTRHELETLAASDAKTPNGETARRVLARLDARFTPPSPAGRWPANVLLDEAMAEQLDQQSGDRPGFKSQNDLAAATPGEGWGSIGHLEPGRREGYDDSGGASRFFYVAKAPAKERPTYTKPDGTKISHPTVKPLSLMRQLVRLVTPPGGTVLDPFAGSGPTVEASILEGFDVIAAENYADYLPLIDIRIARAHRQLADTPPHIPDLFSDEAAV